eukprot:7992000-Lingulodinium_polyedra.AAC.1
MPLPAAGAGQGMCALKPGPQPPRAAPLRTRRETVAQRSGRGATPRRPPQYAAHAAAERRGER